MRTRSLFASTLSLLLASPLACGGDGTTPPSSSTSNGGAGGKGTSSETSTSSSHGGSGTTSSTSSTTSQGGAGGATTSSTASSSSGGGMGGSTSSSSSSSSSTTSSSTSASSSSSSTSASSSSGGAPLVDCSPAAGATATLKLTSIVTGLSSPLLVKAAPDDPDRLYIVERSGKVKIRDNGQLVATPFIDVSNLIVAGNEQGLLGLAFHPNYAQNRRFFLHYSAKGTGDSTIMEFRRSTASPLLADAAPVQLVLKHATAQSNHNGGSIEFGQDGYLYITLGDGGSQNDPECDAQNPANLLGKISRVDVDMPPDANGYPAAAGNPSGLKQYHIGFRNPWRISVDPCTSDIYIGDVGQDNYEEIDIVPAASPGAKNFGWPFREGKHNHASTCPPDPGPWTEPIAEYDHGQGCSVTGGYVYRGSTIPWLRGAYLYGDYCSGAIWTVRYAGGTASAPVTAPGISNSFVGISSFGQDGRGEMYMVLLGGTVYRIDPG